MNLQAEIKKLIDSGEKPQRAVAIAYSMQLKKAKLGTTVGQDPNANYYDNNAPYFSNKRSGASDGYFFGAKSKAEEQARFYEAIYNQDYSGVPSDSMLANDTKHQDVKIYNEFQAQPQQGVQLDLSDNESTATNMDIYKNPEQLQRMQRNKVYNTATNNYDENGNAINTDDYTNKDYYSKLNIYNPYGGIGLDQSLFYAGQGFGNKKLGQAALGTGLSFLKGARGFLSGYSSGKASRESAESSYQQQFKPNTNPVYLSQEGGTISNAEEMTGAYLTETEEAPTVELEKDEFTLNSQTGEIQKVVGEKHTNGGVKSDLPAGSQVLSNYTKIGAKTAKELKEMFDISIKPKDTFAKVMDKIDAKIGYKETIEEETEYLKTLEKQQTLDTNDATKKLNEQHLAKELKENEDKKAELEDKRIEAFQSLFEIQESRPKKGDGTEVLKKEGGNVYDPNVLNLAKQYNLSPDRVIELMEEGGRVPMYQEAGTTPTESDLYGDEYENELINKYGAKQFTREGYSQGVPAQQPTAEAQQAPVVEAPVAEEKVANFDPNSARDTWVAKTGMDWSEAKRLGYTDGSAKDNKKLLSELNDSRFKKEYLRTEPFKKITKQEAKKIVPEETNKGTNKVSKSQDQRIKKLLDNSKNYRGNATVSKKEEKDFGDYIEQTTEYLGNPGQALSHLMKYGDLPAKGFSKNGRTDGFDNILGRINPAKWFNAGFNALDAAENEDYGTAGEEALNALGALSKLKYVKYTPFNKALPPSRQTVQAIGEGAKRLNAPSRMRIRQEGGQTQEQQPDQMQQVTQMIAQALQQGTPPEQVAQQLISMGIPSDQVMQLIQAVAQQMQGQFPQEEQMEGQMSNPQEEAQEPQMRDGGRLPMYQEGSGIKAINEYLSQWEDKPTYKYGDVQATANRFRPFFDKYGIEYTADDLNSLEKIDKLSGQLQTKLIEKHPELAEDYGEKIEPTRQGLQWLVDNKAINPSDYGLKLQNGKVSVGSYGNLSDVQQKKLQIDVQALEGQKKKEFAKTNYNDNQAFFRTLDAKDIEFTNKAEYDQYIKDNEKNKVGDFFRTDKTGAYIKPILKETPEVLPTDIEIDPTTNQPVRGKDLGAKTVMADLPQDLLLPPGSLANLYKGEVRFGEFDPTKMSAEAQNVEAERQRQTAAKELYFLNPQQRAALMASGLGQTQMATNQAIGQAEMFNAQQKQQVDQFNLQNNMKEDLTNIELNKDFERRNLAGQGIYENNMRGFYNNFNAIERQNFADVRDLNLANAAFDKYQTDGSNIMFMPSDTVLNSQGTMKGLTQEQYDKMTDAQKQAFLANAVYAPKKNA